MEGARWHQRRSHGQINRFTHVEDCGTENYWIVCDACSRTKERMRDCRVALLCLRCRGVIAAEKRARFIEARDRAVSRAKTAGLLCTHDRRRWSEKLLTLTVPHRPEHGTRQRIEIAFRALFLFQKALKKWLRSREEYDLVAWFRTFEWTPGADGHGHPHFHFWILCPFLDRELLLRAWAQALRTSGITGQSPETVVLDVREVRDPHGAAHEIIKYLTKDILPGHRLVDPQVFSAVYEALDERRTTQASASFFRDMDRRASCACGAVGAFRRCKTAPEGARRAERRPESER
jgi:hypothetical protein